MVKDQGLRFLLLQASDTCRYSKDKVSDSCCASDVKNEWNKICCRFSTPSNGRIILLNAPSQVSD